MTDWTPADVPSMDGDVVVITGANNGIGLEGTKLFADAGAHVVMACRSVDRGKSAAGEVREAVPDASLSVGRCDLSSLDSVESFAQGVREEYEAIDVLCNNAGVMAIPRDETDDGFEEQFGVNHLGHFALTGHLLPALVAADDEARVVTQSSGVHENGEMDFDDLMGEQSYGKWDAYAQSKLANLLFAYELDRRADAAGIDLTSVGCHPGYADTGLQSRGPQRAGSRLRLAAMKVANAVFAQSAAVGAEPMVYAATHPDLDGGEYVGPGGFMNMRGHPEVQESSEASYDEADAERLWTVSEELTGVEYDFEAVVAAAN